MWLKFSLTLNVIYMQQLFTDLVFILALYCELSVTRPFFYHQPLCVSICGDI